MTESEFKRLFKKSVKYHGGFSASLSSNLHSGLPDLYVIVPSYPPVLIEAKFLKEVGDKFSRKINYSEIQRVFLNSCNKVQPGAAFGLVGFKQGSNLYACLIHPCHNYIDSSFAEYCGVSIVNRTCPYFDIPGLFAWAKKNRHHFVGEVHDRMAP